MSVPCARPRYSRAAPSGSADRHGAARGAAWPVRSRSDWRALAARPRASQSARGNLGPRGLAGLTDFGELAKSRRPWAADSGTSLSLGGEDGGYSSMPPAALRTPQDRSPRIAPLVCFPGTRRHRGLEDRPRGFSRTTILSGGDDVITGNLTARDAAHSDVVTPA